MQPRCSIRLPTAESAMAALTRAGFRMACLGLRPELSDPPHESTMIRSLAVLIPGALVAGLAPMLPVTAGPVVCTTTLEAPLAGAAPIEVTRCGRSQTVPELINRRFFSYTAPFARGVDLTHQVTDLLGISMGGGDGSRVMGFGFPDQTIVWDGTAIENTTAALLDAQSNPMPLRTADLSSCFNSSLAGSSCGQRHGSW